ncbi:hypothetical protein Hbl1158_02405 [Halobaculum sp. CBA1158]|uniref:hypothetical protein n=1 Tax=Halobaculum sp. CBA1158 TaxID=2904243 RepID=UPI001F1F6ED1|nr:hypothetical protein [Halobaculum sp. CBA1158]UIP00242.1 hypothetical protein Hbl1158_02405 [Halobaculum sp. CBA1158]
MSLWLQVIWVAAGLNVVLLLGLSYVWGRNYGRFRSKHTLGLAAFGLILLAENALALYLFYVHADLSAWIAAQAPIAHRAMGGLRVLELVAIAFLAWITWD